MLNFEYPPLGGGSSPVTRSLARTLVAQGDQVDVVTMGFRGLPPEEEDGGVRVLRVPCLRGQQELSRVHELATYTAAALHRVRSLARVNRYDICHSHFLLPTAVVAYLLRRMPGFPAYVVTSHGSDVPGYNPDRFRRLHRFTPPLLRRVVRAAGAVIAPSEALAALIRLHIPEAGPRLVNVPYGVDLDRFRPVRKERRILVATRLFERKGVRDVLEALEGLPPRGWRLELAGDGPQRSDLEAQAGRGGFPVTFHGWLAHDRLDRLFEPSQVFVLATASDNFPASLLEAMAARCAIVTTRAGGCPEVVGDAALLVEPGDVRGLRESLLRLMTDDDFAGELGERAWRRAGAVFGWPAITERHREIYERAAFSKRNGSLA